MEIPIFSLIVFFLLGLVLLHSSKRLTSIPREEKIVLSFALGISLCLFVVLTFLAIQRLF